MNSYMEHYDEINAELQMMAAIALEEEPQFAPAPKRVYIGSGEDFDVILFKEHNPW